MSIDYFSRLAKWINKSNLIFVIKPFDYNLVNSLFLKMIYRTKAGVLRPVLRIVFPGKFPKLRSGIPALERSILKS